MYYHGFEDTKKRCNRLCGRTIFIQIYQPNLLLFTRIPGPIVEATTQLLIY